MDDSGESTQDQILDRNVDNKDILMRFQMEITHLIGDWTKTHLFSPSAKNLSSLSPCSRTF